MNVQGGEKDDGFWIVATNDAGEVVFRKDGAKSERGARHALTTWINAKYKPEEIVKVPTEPAHITGFRREAARLRKLAESAEEQRGKAMAAAIHHSKIAEAYNTAAEALEDSVRVLTNETTEETTDE